MRKLLETRRESVTDIARRMMGRIPVTAFTGRPDGQWPEIVQDRVPEMNEGLGSTLADTFFELDGEMDNTTNGNGEALLDAIGWESPRGAAAPLVRSVQMPHAVCVTRPFVC